MAAIDKIYGTHSQWCEFHDWVAGSKRPQYCRYFYPTPPYSDEVELIGSITNTTIKVDKWLWRNCPIKFVIKQLKEKYRKGYLDGGA